MVIEVAETRDMLIEMQALLNLDQNLADLVRILFRRLEASRPAQPKHPKDWSKPALQSCVDCGCATCVKLNAFLDRSDADQFIFHGLEKDHLLQMITGCSYLKSGTLKNGQNGDVFVLKTRQDSVNETQAWSDAVADLRAELRPLRTTWMESAFRNQTEYNEHVMLRRLGRKCANAMVVAWKMSDGDREKVEKMGDVVEWN